MDGEKRRECILTVLKEKSGPVSGTDLAKSFQVSRQIIVQDIALLRAQGQDILATARGYILNKESANMLKRVLGVKHTPEQLEDELNTIIDNGGRVRDVIIIHPLYGQMVVDLMLRTRRDIGQFVEKVRGTEAIPLMELTKGVHMHTIEASSEEELDFIEHELAVKGYMTQII